MIFTCDTCHCPVTLDEGFFRSVGTAGRAFPIQERRRMRLTRR